MLRFKFVSNIWSYRQLSGTFERQKLTAQPIHIFQLQTAGLRTGCSYIMRTKSHHLSYILRKYPGRTDNIPSKTKIYSAFGINLSVRNTSGKDICPPPEPEKKYNRTLLYGLIAVLTAALGVYYSGLLNKKEKEVKKEEKKRKARWPTTIVKIPESSQDIPDTIPYLLIGGGTASFAAFRAIKSSDPKAKVLVISNENYLPYMRPPLSKEIWFNDNAETTKKLQFKQWNGMERSIFYEPEDFYVDCKKLETKENGGVAVARGWTVKRIDVTEKKAVLEDGYEIHYDKCLIATGSTPKNLPVFENAASAVKQKVSLYRGVYDFEELNDIISDGAKEFAIVGGGFLGSELACALARRGKGKFKVHQIYREPGNMAKVLPEYLSSWTTNKVKAEGVNIIKNAEVEDVSLDGDKIVLKLNNGSNVKVAHAVVTVGVTPNTELAETSSLELDEENGGFLVNAELMARTNLWAAGDCTCFYDVKLGRRRVEHHDHAVVSGRLAGENMTGAGKPYLHQSMFWSDLGPDVGYEAIGIVDSSLPTVGVFARATEKDTPKAVVDATGEVDRSAVEELTKSQLQQLRSEVKTPSPSEVKTSTAVPQPGEDYGKGVIFYLRNDVVVGIIMWNVFNRMSLARQVLKEEKKYEDLNEVAKLFNIHEE